MPAPMKGTVQNVRARMPRSFVGYDNRMLVLEKRRLES